MPKVIALACDLDLDPTVLVIGLIARNESPRNRTAARIANAIFGNIPIEELDCIAHGLRAPSGQ